jgi:hypothetical protein
LIVDSRIQLIASAHNKSALLPEFINFNGQQFFTDILEIKHMKEVGLSRIYKMSLIGDVFLTQFDAARFGGVLKYALRQVRLLECHRDGIA